MQWRKRLEQVAGLDLRSLALFRICVAMVVLYDLADRMRDLTAHYSDLGVIPASTLAEIFGSRVYLSPHVLASGSVAAVAMVFAVHALAAAALLAGYRTRLATVLCWLLSLSLQVRTATFLKGGGDAFVACTLLFGIFLPLGARWSRDQRRESSSRSTATSNWTASVASAAFILQIGVVYGLTGWLKTGDSWVEGRAVWYLLNLEMLTSPLAPWLAQYDWATSALTYASHTFERWGPFLLLVPFATAGLRLFCVVSFSLLHIGMGMFLYLGPYPIMCIAGWLALLPGAFWDRWLPAVLARIGVGSTWIPGESASGADVAALGVARRFMPQIIPALLIGHVLLFSAGTINLFGVNRNSLPAAELKLGRALGINNTWSMMAPNPGNLNWWFLIDGELESGAHADPFHRQEVSWERPDNVLKSLRSWRWRLSLIGLISLPENSERRIVLGNAMGNHVCRDWNRSHSNGDRLISGRYARVVEPIGRTRRQSIHREWLGEFRCPES